MTRSTFRITGIHCEACVKLIAMKTKKIDGVEAASVTDDGILTLSSAGAIMLSEVVRSLQGTEYAVQVI